MPIVRHLHLYADVEGDPTGPDADEVAIYFGSAHLSENYECPTRHWNVETDPLSDNDLTLAGEGG